MNDKDLIIKYGLFYIGLTDKAYWWELMAVNFRKFFFAGATLAAYQHTANLQGLMAFTVVSINHSLLKLIKPYTKEYLNNLDIFASLINDLIVPDAVVFVSSINNCEAIIPTSLKESAAFKNYEIYFKHSISPPAK